MKKKFLVVVLGFLFICFVVRAILMIVLWKYLCNIAAGVGKCYNMLNFCV